MTKRKRAQGAAAIAIMRLPLLAFGTTPMIALDKLTIGGVIQSQARVPPTLEVVMVARVTLGRCA